MIVIATAAIATAAIAPEDTRLRSGVSDPTATPVTTAAEARSAPQ
jgi:hypothetical protein